MNTGISLYFSGGIEKNRQMIQKAASHSIRYAFTSLHIPEENGIDYDKDIRELLRLCQDGGLQLIVDVGPETLHKLGVSKPEELEEKGITHVRLDYGFTPEETVRISKKLQVVFNASTITEQNLKEWKEAGADFSCFTACHNFYPKAFTALSVGRVAEINQRLKYLGFTTMAFVPGNKELRGPLGEGLPTVEEHRGRKDETLLNMLELFYDGLCDVVLVGDVDVEDRDWRAMECLEQGYVELAADVMEDWGFIRKDIHHDRSDSSSYVFRSQESRQYKGKIPVQMAEGAVREAGSIFISNDAYLRYSGELEIARIELPPESRVNIIGRVAKKDCKYLPYIRNGLGIRLI